MVQNEPGAEKYVKHQPARARLNLATIALALVPVVVAAGLVFHLRARAPALQLFAGATLQPIAAGSARQLKTLFDNIHYAWPPRTAVPALAVQHLPDDIGTLGVDAKKEIFFKTLMPLVLAENARIAQQRQFIEAQFAAGNFYPGTPGWQSLARLAASYQIEGSLNDPAVRARLLRRVDQVPPALVLAQAAKESGWGTSRFAREANNLFGVWTWQKDAGLVPREAGDDAKHYVRAFADLRDSVRAYLYNINIGHAYVTLRQLRAAARAAGGVPDARRLAGALQAYSERGHRYVHAVRAIMAQNGLDALATSHPQLASGGLITVSSPAPQVADQAAPDITTAPGDATTLRDD